MSDILQFLGLFLLPVGMALLASVFFGWIGAAGVGIIIAAVLLWFIGREMNLAKIAKFEEAERRAIETGWTDDERAAMKR